MLQVQKKYLPTPTRYAENTASSALDSKTMLAFPPSSFSTLPPTTYLNNVGKVVL